VEQIYLLVVGAAVPIVVGGVIRFVGRFLRSRVKFAGPDDRRLAALRVQAESQARLTTALLRLQRPVMDAMIALLEATQGKNNGNVDSALTAMRQARKDFDCYLMGEATLNECLEAEKD
jgi:hypothetical protein